MLTPPVAFDARLHSSERSESPPTSFGQEEDHHKKYSKNQHNQASHWQAAHGLEPQPGRRFTSLQWVAKKDPKDSTKSKSPSVTVSTPAKVTSSASEIQSAGKPVDSGSTTTKSVAKQTPSIVSIQKPTSSRATEVKPESVVATTETACDENNDSWDFDNYFPDEDEKIDGTFSIGMIDWYPANRTRHVLSAMWSEAEMQELGVIAPGEEVETTSVSRYIKDNNLSEACRPVNKSKDWHIIRNDPAFADLSKEARFVTVAQLRERREVGALTPERVFLDDRETELSRAYAVIDRPRASPPDRGDKQRRKRPFREVEAEEDEAYSPPPVPTHSTPGNGSGDPAKAQATSMLRKDESAKLNATPTLRGAESTVSNAPRPKDKAPASVTKLQKSDAPSTSVQTSESKLTQSKKVPSTNDHRTVSNDSTAAPSPHQLDAKQEEILARLGVTGPPKIDQKQEDVLAMLGVTGAPKPVGSRPTPVANVINTNQYEPGSQEDILARLGVTGEAKPVGSAPGPSYRAYKQVSGVTPTRSGVTPTRSEQTTPTLPTLPTKLTRTTGIAPTNHPLAQPTDRAPKPPSHASSVAPGTADFVTHWSAQGYSGTQGYPTSIASMPPPPPPPPPLEDLPEGADVPRAEQHEVYLTAFDTFDGNNGRPSSRNSQHTQAGSDFHDDEPQLEVTMHGSGSEDDRKTPEPDISIGKGSLRARKRSRKQIEADEDADTIQAKLEETGLPARKKRQTRTTATTASKYVSLHNLSKHHYSL